MNSRKLQNIQHLVGGFYQILLVIMGVYVGKGNTSMSIIFGVLSFTTSRGAMELQYQVQKALLEEHGKQRTHK